MSIKHDHTLNPVTALEFYWKPGALFIFAGEGPYLKIFRAETSKLLCQCRVFHSQAIHGIAVRGVAGCEGDLQAVIWGGSSIALLRKEQLEHLLSNEEIQISSFTDAVSDWILDVAISPYDGDSCLLVTAHNTVLRAKLGGKSQNSILETHNSPSRSILYSAHLVWESPSLVTVAAGTVFGEIIVWQCSTGDFTLTGSRVCFIFAGHEGSIFGVNISAPFVSHDGTTKRLLASCSDDRTIRVWDLSENSTTSAQPTPDVETPRETGFGSNGYKDINEQASTRCLTTAMGHASRIWRVKFIVSHSSSLKLPSVSLLSFGEDATAQQWTVDFGLATHAVHPLGNVPVSTTYRRSLESDPHGPGRLIHKATFAFHSGKHIWSVATCQFIEPHTHLATGGADGKIALYNIRPGLLSDVLLSPDAEREGDAKLPIPKANAIMIEASQSGMWDVEDILKTLPSMSPEPTFQTEMVLLGSLARTPSAEIPLNCKPDSKPKVKKVAKDSFNRYAFVSEDQVMVTTAFGRVLLGHIQQSIKWEELLLPELSSGDLRSYSITKGIPEIGVAYLSGTNGNIYMYRNEQMLSEVGKVDSKVADMFSVYDPGTNSFGILVTTLARRVATLFSSRPVYANSPGEHGKVTFQLPERFMVTSAGNINNLLILGSRSGSLSIYDFRKRDAPLSVWIPEDAEARDAITAITALPNEAPPNSSNKTYFLTTCRNGSFSIFTISVTHDTDLKSRAATVYPVQHGTPPFGPMIETAWFKGSELFLSGFRSKNFVVWNETKQCEISNVECGGAHRSYAYSPLRDSSGGGNFVYSKASKLCVHLQRSSSHQIIKQGGHGREIKACAVTADGGLIATGAEDTAIRIWEYDDCKSLSTNRFKCLSIVQKHTAGIQHLQWYGSEYLFSSGGTEEFFIWAIERIPGFGIGVICEATCPDQSEDRDLRIMSFDVLAFPDPSNPIAKRLLISLAYSDSTIRTYTYSALAGFQLVATGRYTSCCLTQICHIQLDGNIILLTAATDGNLTSWTCPLPKDNASYESQKSHALPPQLSMISTHKIHQSSIKSFEVALTESKQYIVVATAGDDNALGVTIYTACHPMNVTTPSAIAILSSAHAAALTGLCFGPGLISEEGVDELRIITSSNDQRIKEWTVRVIDKVMPRRQKECHLEVEKIGDVFTPVADVGDIAMLTVPQGSRLDSPRENQVLVVGNGMEVWNISCRG